MLRRDNNNNVILLKDNCLYINKCISHFPKHYLHFRVRGGGVEDSKSIDSASEPCNIKIMKLLNIATIIFFEIKYRIRNALTLSSSPSLSH